MGAMRWVLTIAIGLVVLAGGGYAVLQIPSVQDQIVARAVQSALARTRDDLFQDDALRVALCGTTGPLVDFGRAKSCNVIVAGGKFYVVDIGPESTEVLNAWRLPMARLGGVFVTHLHSDHIGELGELNMQSWAQGRGKALTVYGPPGIEDVTQGFATAYAHDRDYRIAHHGADLMSAEAWNMAPVAVAMPGEPTPAHDRTTVVLKDGDLTVTAIEVNHEPIHPAYAYRFDYKGRSVVISGDTSKHMPLAAAAKDVDVLLHEAQAKHVVAQMIVAAKNAGDARLTKIFSDIQNYHTSPVEAAEIANAANAKLLVLTHFTPPPANPIVAWSYLRGVAAARPSGVIMGDDNMLIVLPLAAKDRIDVGRMK